MRVYPPLGAALLCGCVTLVCTLLFINKRDLTFATPAYATFLNALAVLSVPVLIYVLILTFLCGFFAKKLTKPRALLFALVASFFGEMIGYFVQIIAQGYTIDSVAIGIVLGEFFGLGLPFFALGTLLGTYLLPSTYAYLARVCKISQNTDLRLPHIVLINPVKEENTSSTSTEEKQASTKNKLLPRKKKLPSTKGKQAPSKEQTSASQALADAKHPIEERSNVNTRKRSANEFSEIKDLISHLVDVCGAKVLVVDWAKGDLTPGESFVFCGNFVLLSDTGRETAINENTTSVLQNSGFIVHKFSPASSFNAMDCVVNLASNVIYVGCSMSPFTYKSEYSSAGTKDLVVRANSAAIRELRDFAAGMNMKVLVIPVADGLYLRNCVSFLPCGTAIVFAEGVDVSHIEGVAIPSAEISGSGIVCIGSHSVVVDERAKGTADVLNSLGYRVVYANTDMFDGSSVATSIVSNVA